MPLTITPAVLKLIALAAFPGAIAGLLVVIGILIGRIEGSHASVITSGFIGALFGWAASMIAYFVLFVYFFDLALDETYHLILIIWALQTAVGGLIVQLIHRWLQNP